MDMYVQTWEEWFLQILEVVTNAITTLLGMLPNPDPFPEIISGMTFDSTDAFRVAWYWLDTFIDMELFLSVMTMWFSMFALAWIIQMLWKWIKAR